MGYGRGAGDQFTWSNRLCNAGLGTYHGPVSHLDMIYDADLTADNHLAPDVTAPGDTCLGHDDGILSNDDIMSDMHQIVGLGPTLDPCLSKCSPINTVVGPDLHAVIDLDDPGLRDLYGRNACLLYTSPSPRD